MEREELKELLEEILEFADNKEYCREQVETVANDSHYPKNDWQESSSDFKSQNEYGALQVLNYIMYRGETVYNKNSVYCLMEDSASLIFKAISNRLTNLYDFDYAIVKEESACIAIAVPEFIKDAKTKVSLALGIIPDAFTEVSGPTSTVLIIDCEKQFLRKQYLGIGESAWLL